MSNWYKAQLFVNGRATEYTGAGDTKDEAIDDIGLTDIELGYIQAISKTYEVGNTLVKREMPFIRVVSLFGLKMKDYSLPRE